MPGHGHDPTLNMGARARIAGTLLPGSLSLAGAVGWFRAQLAEEAARGRLALWTPVAFAGGIVAYFALPREPQLWALGAGVLVAGFAAYCCRGRAAAFGASLGAMLFVAGAAVAKLHVLHSSTPVLVERVNSASIEGRITAVERTAQGLRLTVRPSSLRGVSPERMPSAIRLTWRNGGPLPSPGTRIRARAALSPPPGPVAPGAHDPARELYFAGVGAVGVIIGQPDFSPAADEVSLRDRLSAGIFALRQGITARIRETVPGEEGAIAAALLAGERGGISAATNEALRASGLAHVISISGLHMALCAGSVFVFVWSLLALVPGLALRRPIRKWAALAALAATTGYLALSGADYAAQRSYVMVTVMFLAILCDRQALAMRNVAAAALIVLLLFPQSVLSASFQMSFAATAALIAAYEAGAARLRPELAARSLAARLPLLAAGVLIGAGVTSVVAGLAADPFAALHFHKVAMYSVIANMAAGPVIDLLVMPLGFAGLAAMPFGLDPLFLEPMRWGVAWMLRVAQDVASWPGAVQPVAAMPSPALWLALGGGLWLCLWRGAWRLWGAPLILVAWAVALLSPERADVLIDGNGRTAAVRQGDGRLAIVRLSRGRFAAARWLEADADPRSLADESLQAGTRCDALGCTSALPGNRIVALALHPQAFLDDCRRAAILVTPLQAPPDCDGPRLLIDRKRLERYGAHALQWPAGKEAPRIATAWPGPRPWTRAPSAEEDDPESQ
ncbi:MAG: ComEC family competence protein [Pseudomonadota bacterium]|nr:ComEC family competence protein [Pseudomonadota bacterium]